MNILLSGALGKMGEEVIKAVEKTKDYKIICGYDTKTENKNFPVYSDIKNIKENPNVIIDFSKPEGSLEILKYARNKNIPIVIATTGFNEEENKIIEEYSKEIPIFKSSNMSLNINLMADILKKVSKYLKDDDIEIIDIHHNRKVDSPSGTAILLADSINEELEEKKEYNLDRMQKREKRNKNEIGFSSIRGGNIVGDHKVIFYGENESLEITHKAYSREVFAEGALDAAKFIVNQKPGIYTMKNLIK